MGGEGRSEGTRGEEGSESWRQGRIWLQGRRRIRIRRAPYIRPIFFRYKNSVLEVERSWMELPWTSLVCYIIASPRYMTVTGPLPDRFLTVTRPLHDRYSSVFCRCSSECSNRTTDCSNRTTDCSNRTQDMELTLCVSTRCLMSPTWYVTVITPLLNLYLTFN